MTVTVPAGMSRTDDHRYSWHGTELHVDGAISVTGILKIIDKPALVSWAKRETAECAIRNIDMLADMRRTAGDRLAVEWLKGIPDYQRDTAANRGTRVHAAADAYAQGIAMDVEPDDMPFVDAYRNFLEDYDVRIVAAELMVMGRTPAGWYGGTLDLVADLSPMDDDPGPHRWLLDLKTSKGTYRETGLQLCGYGGASFAGFPGDTTPYALPEGIERYGVVHLRPDVHTERGYALVPYEVGESTWDAFCAAHRLSQWLTARKGDNLNGSNGAR